MWDFALLIVGGVAVWAGAEGLVTGAVKIARYFGVSAMVVGLTVVSLGTSAPELVVSAVAAYKGNSDIALGNVLGSNIINIALILGVTCLLTTVHIGKEVLRQDLPLLIAVTGGFLALLFAGGTLSRVDGLVLLLGMVGYSLYTGIRAWLENRRTTAFEDWERPELRAYHVLLLFVGIPLLAAGADWMVRGAQGVALLLGVPPRIVAMTMVAFGTSVPELAASIVAARHGEGDLAVGNVLGSNLYNILLIMGTAAAIRPVTTTLAWNAPDILLFLAAVIILVPLALRRRMGIGAGLLLLTLYAASVVLLFT